MNLFRKLQCLAKNHMHMLQTLIIDDEAHIRDSLKKLLARHCPQVQVA